MPGEPGVGVRIPKDTQLRQSILLATSTTHSEQIAFPQLTQVPTATEVG
jgi:serine/threonine-protein kinase RIO1